MGLVHLLNVCIHFGDQMQECFYENIYDCDFCLKLLALRASKMKLELICKQCTCRSRCLSYSLQIFNLIPYLFGYKITRWDFPLCRMTTNNYISPMKICYITSFPFLRNIKDLNLSYKMDLDFCDRFGR